VNTAGRVESSWGRPLRRRPWRKVSTAKAAKPWRRHWAALRDDVGHLGVDSREGRSRGREFFLQVAGSWRGCHRFRTMLLAIPLDVLLIFTFHILIMDFGAADYSGTGAAVGHGHPSRPRGLRLLVVSGAPAPRPCALILVPARIREELDALRVMGCQPDPGPSSFPGCWGSHRGSRTLLSSVVILVGFESAASSSSVLCTERDRLARLWPA